MNTLKNVIIFGATSSIAEHVARQLVAEGASIYCVARNQLKLQAVLDDLKVRSGDNQKIDGKTIDLIDIEKHEHVIKEAQTFLGTVDAILIAHGSLPDQQACQADMKLLCMEFETNGLSVVSLLSHSANILEQQKNGVLAVISSVAGDRGRQSNYVYGAAKGMVSIFAEGLRNRLAKSNVDVVVIKPGFVDTPMTENFDKSSLLWVKPDRISTGIVKAMRKGKETVYLPWFWWGIMLIIKHIPEFIFKKLSF